MIKTSLLLAALMLSSAASPAAQTSLDSSTQKLLSAACSRAVMLNAYAGGLQVDRADGLKLSPTQLACVVRGKRTQMPSEGSDNYKRAWVFVLNLGKNGLERDKTSAWTEIPLSSE